MSFPRDVSGAGPAPWGTDHVTVAFGDTTALNDITLTAVPGQVAAVVGGDGAGKTTLLRTLVGRIRPQSGRVIAPEATACGFMPTGASGVWRELTVDENIAFVAAAHHITGTALEERRTALLGTAGLDRATDRLAGALSGGMRQKLAFCMAIFHDPELLVLDEPSTGVDPVSRVDLWRLISRAAAAGTAVVMATSYLDEAERSSNCLVLDRGHALAFGPPQDILTHTPGTLTTGTAPSGEPELSWRRGRQTRSWHPGPPRPGEQPIPADMEDAVIALTLADQQQES
ncbi:ABC transporter ATP-binding protein [Streptomyces sp. ICBB 8177]|uniref:ABC transporter ATP-binding protein n=1 Tax=Streptomyces sp. ICBB 8177 TaxID=563922 RepID=UPI000D679EF7|nr:ABC transporter ATP-binding protein [Streptomyces sp. ICBB 8177]PWI45035.1 ABC transporter [Streptomyces sp. ICBB 8177]